MYLPGCESSMCMSMGCSSSMCVSTGCTYIYTGSKIRNKYLNSGVKEAWVRFLFTLDR